MKLNRLPAIQKEFHTKLEPRKIQKDAKRDTRIIAESEIKQIAVNPKGNSQTRRIVECVNKKCLKCLKEFQTSAELK